MKLILTYLLLSSFVVLLTPRDFWHDCHHDHSDHDHTENIEVLADAKGHDLSSSPVEMEDDCYACDFDLGFFTKNRPGFLSIMERVHCQNAIRILSHLNVDEGYTFSLRGPPVAS